VFIKSLRVIFKIKYLSVFICVHLWIISSVFAQEKGKDADWESAGKQGIGTALSEKSKVWFTLQGGSLTEVFYPTADKANVQFLQFVVVNSKTKKVETERDDAVHQIKTLRPDSLSFQQINKSKTSDWTIVKTYTTDVERDSILIDVQFRTKNKNLNLYVYYNPSLGNSGMGDTSSRTFGLDDPDGRLIVEETKSKIASALRFSSETAEQTNGFYEVNDGIEQLKEFGKIVKLSNLASDGNVAQIAKIVNPTHFTAVLSFAEVWLKAVVNAAMSVNKGFVKTQSEYDQNWSDYVKTLPKVDAKYQTQFNFAAMVLRASEDKTFRGGSVASLSNPWIPTGDANGPYVGGYHLVWSRDLYQVATAYIALGDKDSANRALDYLFKYQQKPDGSYPQISWLDGKTLGDAIQMDEISYPLILAYQLNRIDRETYEKHVKPTADFIAKNGSKTGQERWEEKSGYSPSTIAAEIAGLVCAADIATKNGDQVSAKNWLEKADDWAKNVEKWTATKTGKYGDGNYYIRLSAKGTPDAGEKIELNNNAGIYLENEIVDAGFLELVRLGIKSPNDPLIIKSLKVVDDVLKVKTPNGEGFYRYNHDGYGEMEDGRPWNFDRKYSGKGHLWALLTGERGQYEIALADSKLKPKNSKLIDPRLRLDAMLKFANDAYMIPEQVWDNPNGPFQFGEGAGSATPLAWSMAQFIRLAMNIKNGKNIDTPEVVARRYGNLK
jgi:glucoamylase